jgi:excisionase family DNA binding protein
MSPGLSEPPTPAAPLESLLALRDVQTALNFKTKRPILRLIAEGKLKALRVGRRALRFRRSDVLDYLNSIQSA